MPYNTRRKSLSLPSLGIQLPHSSRSHRSSHLKHPTDPQSPPSKRVRRSSPESSVESSAITGSSTERSSASRTSISSSSSSATLHDKNTGTTKSRGRAYTPPPSPGAIGDVPKIDTEGINDDIVTDVIEQLEKTGNRPHLIKELAAVLCRTNESVASSANPAALLSSRLSTYLRRHWTALSPCPIAKELIPVHPRKVFFYLTTCPRQDLPDNSDDILPPTSKRVISPSLSGESMDQDEDVDRSREAMSPSPEIDLSSSELDLDLDLDDLDEHGPCGPPTPGSFSGIPSFIVNCANNDAYVDGMRRSQCALEGDEVDFQSTANSMQSRNLQLRNEIYANKRRILSQAFSSFSNSNNVDNRYYSSNGSPSNNVINDSNSNDHGDNSLSGTIEGNRMENEVGTNNERMSLSTEDDETPEIMELRNKEAADALFGTNTLDHGMGLSNIMSSQSFLSSSPTVKTNDFSMSIDAVSTAPATTGSSGKKVEFFKDDAILMMGGGKYSGGLWDIKNPETVELEELDDMFGEY